MLPLMSRPVWTKLVPKAVFVNQVVIDSTNCGETFGELCGTREVFAKLYPGNSGLDRIVFRTSLLRGSF